MYISSNRAVARIFLDNIKSNINTFKSIRDEKVKVCAVVKADAYGHGSIEVSRHIQNIVDYFAVSTGDEAVELRYSGISRPILVLGYVFEDEIENLINNNIYFTIYNTDIAQKINDVAQKMCKKASVHIKLDTGMSRIGFVEDDFYIENIKHINNMSNIEIIGCFSHFTSADETTKDYSDIQFAKFKNMCEKLEKENINLGIKHISNSSASETTKYDLDMIRLGIGMYGYSLNDIKNEKLSLKPAMRLESIVSNIKLLSSGNTVSYSKNYILEKDEWIATIPIGYADGVSRSLSNKNFEVMFENKVKGVSVGNICMDQMMIRVDKKVEIGTKVYIFGYDDISGYTISDVANTIIDEIVCDVHKRVKRQYE